MPARAAARKRPPPPSRRCAAPSRCRSPRPAARTRAVPRTRGRRAVEGAAPHLLRRARGRQGAGHRRRRASRGDAGRRDRRRHHGGRHRHVLRQCRHSGHGRRGDAPMRWSAASTRLRGITAARRRAAPSRPTEMEARFARIAGATEIDAVCRRRHRDRSGVRGFCRQAAGVRRSRPHRQGWRGARLQHLLSRHRCAGARARHGRKRWSACTSSARRTSCASSKWCAAPPTAARDACDRDCGGAPARQDSGSGRRVPRLRRQPHAAGALRRGGTPAARRRAAAGRRCRD